MFTKSFQGILIVFYRNSNCFHMYFFQIYIMFNYFCNYNIGNIIFVIIIFVIIIQAQQTYTGLETNIWLRHWEGAEM